MCPGLSWIDFNRVTCKRVIDVPKIKIVRVIFILSISSERRHGQVVRAALLWCRKSPEGHEFKTGLRHPTTGKLSLS